MTENLEEKYFLRKMKMFLIPGGLKLDKSFQTDEIRQAWLWGVMIHVLVQYVDSAQCPGLLDPLVDRLEGQHNR